ncbi:phytanoyl-CoA dioxygenase [Amylocystis lapponica]|nr:phytanoyl-CoA dioxygenase [Amylocystis lapponica]
MTAQSLGYLTQEQVDQFRRDGYLRLPTFLSSVETEALLTRSKQLIEQFSIEDHPLTKFTTGDDNHIGDDYFLTSGDKIRYFLEEDAVDKNGKLNREKQRAVNKIGHALHELDPVFRAVTIENPSMRAVVRDLQFHHDPVALQSMVICKQPEIGGEVPEHNDSTFLYTSPPSALGFWIALEKCTPENGALSFLPGSHLSAPITKRFVRLPSGGTGFEQLIPPERAPTAPEGTRHGADPRERAAQVGAEHERAHTLRLHVPHDRDAPHAAYDAKNWLQPTPAMPFPHVLDVPNATTVPVGAGA